MTQPDNWGVMNAGPAGPVAVVDRINDSLNALLSLHSGSSRPVYALAGSVWLDTSGDPYVVKFYDGTNDIALFYVDTTLHTAWTQSDAPEVTVASGVTTDIFAANSWRVFISGDSGPIGSFGTTPNKTCLVRLDKDVLISHGTAIACPGGIDFQGRAGMQFFVFSDGSGNARIGPGMRADGTALVPGGNEEVDALTLTTAKIAMQLAAVKGSSINLIGEIADSFADVAGLDVVNCVNMDTSETGVIKPTVSLGTLFPTTGMTADSDGGYTASASSVFSGSAAYIAFNGVKETITTNARAWISAAAAPQWLRLQMPVPQTITVYTITAPSTTADLPGCPKDWTLEGSNDGSSWNTVDTRAGIATWTVTETRTYEVTAPSSYSYYRLNISATQGAITPRLAELELRLDSTGDSMTAISAVYDIPSDADFVDAYFVIEPVDTVTLNTDLLISATVDGSAFAAGTASSVETVGDLVVCKATSMDVRSDPGTALQWKIDTANGKMVKVHEIDVRVRKAA